MPVPGWVVDMLPRRLWKPGNLFMPFGHNLHFCSALDAGASFGRSSGTGGKSVGEGSVFRTLRKGPAGYGGSSFHESSMACPLGFGLRRGVLGWAAG
jgi:hypothetical protein